MDSVFNLTAIDEELYFSNKNTIMSLLFSLLILVTACLMCAVAQLFADEINWKLILFLLLAAEICNWLAYATVCLGNQAPANDYQFCRGVAANVSGTMSI